MTALPTRVGSDAAHAPAVICVHSSASSPRQWDALAPALGSDYRVIAPELIGYGAAPDWSYDRALSLDDEARRLEPLLDAEPDGVHIVGHSYGGAVALRLAVRNPKRVRSVVLYEPALFAVLRDTQADSAAAGNCVTEIMSVRIAIRRAVYSGRAAHAAQVFVDYWAGAGAWAALDARRQAAITSRMRKVDAEFDAVFYNAMPLAAYGRLDVPVLLLAGEHTRRPTRRIADLLGSVLPDASRRELRGAGHMGPITHAAEVNARIGAFLDAQRVRAPLARAA
jgi:pimeloyl-ACP methyl ester carboxylesterase